MAHLLTQDIRATNTPKGLQATLALRTYSVGDDTLARPETRVLLENVSNSERVRWRFAPENSVPAQDAKGHDLEPGESREFGIPIADEIWIWTPREGAEVPCILTEI